MDEAYQKVAYIGLRNPDGTYQLNVPLYVKLNEIGNRGLSYQQEEIIHKISTIMMKQYESKFSELITRRKKPVLSN